MANKSKQVKKDEIIAPFYELLEKARGGDKKSWYDLIIFLDNCDKYDPSFVSFIKTHFQNIDEFQNILNEIQVSLSDVFFTVRTYIDAYVVFANLLYSLICCEMLDTKRVEDVTKFLLIFLKHSALIKHKTFKMKFNISTAFILLYEISKKDDKSDLSFEYLQKSALNFSPRAAHDLAAHYFELRDSKSSVYWTKICLKNTELSFKYNDINSKSKAFYIVDCVKLLIYFQKSDLAYNVLNKVPTKEKEDQPLYLLGYAMLYSESNFSKKSLNKSLSYYSEYISKTNESQYYADIASIYKRENRLSEYIDALKLGGDLGSARCLHALATEYYHGGKVSEALELWKRILSLEKISDSESDYYDDAAFHLGDYYYYRANDSATAIKYYKKIKNVGVQKAQLGRLYYYLDDFEKAKELLIESSYQYHCNLGYLFLSNLVKNGTLKYEHEEKNAIDILKDGIKDCGYDYTLVNGLFPLFFNEKFGIKRDIKEGLAFFENAYKNSPSHLVVMDSLSDVYYRNYDEFKQTHNPKKAFELESKIEKISPGYSCGLGHMYEYGDVPNGKVNYKKAFKYYLSYGRTSLDSYGYIRACFLILNNKIPGKTGCDAFMLLEESLKNECAHTALFRLIGDFYCGIIKGIDIDYKRSIDYYDMSIKMFYDNDKSHFGIAYCIYQLKDKDNFEVGKEHLNKAKELGFSDDNKLLQILEDYYEVKTDVNAIRTFADKLSKSNTWSNNLNIINNYFKKEISSSVYNSLTKFTYYVPLQKGIKNYLDNVLNYSDKQLGFLRDYSDCTNQIAKTLESILADYYLDGYFVFLKNEPSYNGAIQNDEITLGSAEYFLRIQDSINHFAKQKSKFSSEFNSQISLRPFAFKYIKTIMNKDYLKQHIKLKDDEIARYFTSIFKSLIEFSKIRNPGAHKEAVERADAEKMINQSVYKGGLIERLIMSVDIEKVDKYKNMKS